MRKRKLYLSEFCERNRNKFITGGILYDQQDNSFEFKNLQELIEFEKQMQVTYEILEWTYSEYFGYIILIK